MHTRTMKQHPSSQTTDACTAFCSTCPTPERVTQVLQALG